MHGPRFRFHLKAGRDCTVSVTGPWHTMCVCVCVCVCVCGRSVQALCCVAADLFKICNRNDPQLNNCVKESIEDLLPKLKSGKLAASLNTRAVCFLKLVATNSRVRL